jgi:hypothetical protein
MNKDIQRRSTSSIRESLLSMGVKVGLLDLVTSQAEASECGVVLEMSTQVPHHWN